MEDLVFTTHIPHELIKSYNYWSSLKEGIKKNQAFLSFANSCEKHKRNILDVVDLLA